jgi:simple sugar transport system substrate-binding protein
MRKTAPDAQIIAVTHEWGAYYTARVKAVQSGQWQTGNVWGGVKEGMVRVGDFGPQVPKAVQAEVLAKQKQVASGQLQPFAGPIRNNEGKLVVPAGQALTDAEILGMNYLVAGVQGKVNP